MGQGLSCGSDRDHDFFRAVQLGEVELVEAAVDADPGLLRQGTPCDRLSALHIAAANGRTEVLSMILGRSVEPDILNRHKQTPLMLAAMHGKIACVEKLLSAGANILMFDSLHGRTCLHYAAYYGHHDCLKTILQAAQSSPIAGSWGFARFVNVRDGDGATPLHLAARQRRPDCVHLLLNSGALVGASTGNYGCPGSTPLHLAARGGSLDCVRALLAWGADRLQIDSSGRIPYTVALRRNHSCCAALLNPSSAEPLVWPAPLKFISELEPEAKALLEKALMEANLERERSILKETTITTTAAAAGATPSMMLPLMHPGNDGDGSDEEDSEVDLCCICFEQACTIEVRSCGHQMCASCILALCCHSKPDPTTLATPAPVCPFCRSSISQLVVAQKSAKVAEEEEEEVEVGTGATTTTTTDDLKPRRSARASLHLSECGGSSGSNSFKSLTTAALGVFGLGSGRVSDTSAALEKTLAAA